MHNVDSPAIIIELKYDRMENKGGTFQINPYLCRAMPKKHLIISTSTELVRFVPDKIVYIKADGNYSKIHQVDGETKLIVFQLGKIEEAIDKQLGADGKPFARIGKSIIINCSFVYSINVPKKELVLSDMATFYHTLNPSEIALKELKKHIEVDKEKYYAKEL